MRGLVNPNCIEDNKQFMTACAFLSLQQVFFKKKNKSIFTLWAAGVEIVDEVTKETIWTNLDSDFAPIASFLPPPPLLILSTFLQPLTLPSSQMSFNFSSIFSSSSFSTFHIYTIYTISYISQSQCPGGACRYTISWGSSSPAGNVKWSTFCMIWKYWKRKYFPVVHYSLSLLPILR